MVQRRVSLSQNLQTPLGRAKFFPNGDAPICWQQEPHCSHGNIYRADGQIDCPSAFPPNLEFQASCKILLFVSYLVARP